jgi:hypothetical protein
MDQGVLDLTGQHGIGQLVQQIVGVQPRVEAVAADERARVQISHAAQHPRRDAQRGVHGGRDAHESGAAHASLIER